MTGTEPRPEAPEPTEQVRDAVLAVPGVLGMSPGTFGEIGTYLDGRRVTGVRWIRGRCEVHVVARFGVDLTALAERVRGAVTPLTAGPVDVTIADLDTGDPEPPAPHGTAEAVPDAAPGAGGEPGPVERGRT